MNKKELVASMAQIAEVSQNNANKCLDAFLDVVCEEIGNGGEINITGYMKFSVVDRKARMGRNPQTGETISVPAAKAVKIQAGSKLKAVAKELEG